jgi:hypothetical protein
MCRTCSAPPQKNSSDMNEIILAPCDAGYVQICTG